MRVKLDDVCERGSSNLKQSDIIECKNGYPIYGASGLLGNIDFYHQDKAYVAVVKDGAGIGRTMFLPEKSSIIGTMQYLLPKQNILPRYLYYVVRYMHLEKYFSGATIPHIYFRDYKNEKFNLDSIEEQKKIVQTLEKVETVIEARQQQLQKLDELVKSRFVKMFGRIANDKKVPMSEVCLIITDGTHQPPKFTSSGIPFLFVSNIAGNEITYDSEKYISEETYTQLIKRTPIEIGDVLLSTVGSYGHPAVVKSNKPFCFQRHIAYLKPKTQLIDSYYLHGAILSVDIQKQIEERVKGIAQKTLNLSEIRKLRLPLPPIALQKQFAEFVKQVDKSKFIIQSSLDETQLLFDSLMQKYFQYH